MIDSEPVPPSRREGAAAWLLSDSTIFRWSGGGAPT